MVTAGSVHIEDDVEIGALSSIDRGVSADTRVGAGTKIDNQVQVGHDTLIGRNCLIAAQVGIAGACVVGDHVTLWGAGGRAQQDHHRERRHRAGPKRPDRRPGRRQDLLRLTGRGMEAEDARNRQPGPTAGAAEATAPTPMTRLDRLTERLNLKEFQLRALLDLTKAINNNIPDAELLKLYAGIMHGELGITRLMLFEHDGLWRMAHAYGADGASRPDAGALIASCRDITFIGGR
jgi:hypothetical protein